MPWCIRTCSSSLALPFYPPHAVTGTPGIGKSYFLYYLLTQLLALPEPPTYILWEHYGKQGQMVRVLHLHAKDLFAT